MGYVAAIPLLPALAFVVLAPMSRAMRNKARWVSVAAILGALGLSVAAFASVWPGGHAGEPVYHASMTLATLGGVPLQVGIMLDAVSAAMLIVITVVGACVQVYSLGYMHRDERVGWYYAALSLFTAAMLLLVLADNFLLLYVAWEIMGLCSYLLIGFWHEQEAPRKASMKAFMTTRVGDIGFAIGLFVMFATVGSFGFADVLGAPETWAPGVATAVALLLLFGAMGKSAQVPLHVWLPDAMAGPTPASALIHAATMVAAGVYLVARAFPIFEASATALTVTLFVGATTALVGGLLAAVQHDIKKVLAYSTISQLGYMFVALGAGGAVAGLYHLVTHAFFKSLLFLGAGVIIHAYHTQDMREMGGLRRYLPWTTATFTVGALALAGVPPLGGFWSKDEILTVLWHEHHYVTWAIALGAAFVTAFYVARLWFRVFAGPKQTEELHEGHKEMILPMVLLASITAVIGFFGPRLGEFLGHEIPWPDPFMAGISVTVAASGLALGWWAYGRPGVVLNTRSLKSRAGYGYEMLAQKLYFDLTYETFIVRPYMRLAALLSRFDAHVVDGVVNGTGELWRRVAGMSSVFDIGVIDGAVNGAAGMVKSLGVRARRIQGGRIQTYQRLAVGALVALLVPLVLWIVLKGA
ncbi:MAG: NADH-quinone oxidoreductase subunit L [Actinomycetota bacterium]|nr:NADH-quinone oxidoreductase subunit L [Actinomycetota bacterium]